MANQGISKITVKGFKSLYDETSIDVRPLTILAGANSSGKSSIMQPLLLMKQTLEATYTPKVFKLDGPNVVYTDPRQFFHIDAPESILQVSIIVDNIGTLTAKYLPRGQKPPQIIETAYQDIEDAEFKLNSDDNHESIFEKVPEEIHGLRRALANISSSGEVFYGVGENRCFFDLALIHTSGDLAMYGDPLPYKFFPVGIFARRIQDIIHVPGLRDNPQRNYPVAQIDEYGHFKGTFNEYFASVIADWGNTDEEHQKFTYRLVDNLMELGLSDGLSTLIHNNQIAIEIPFLNTGKSVNIADVGLAVSQVLPVLTALLVAKQGQLVYLEQPELHLHPRAQVKLAKIIADAANRGVRVVVETHSSLLLIGIQTLIAEGKLNPEDTILHWFTRSENGKTTVDSQVPDDTGAYGDWPEDFADVELDAQGAYIDAVAKRQFSQEAGD